MNESGTEIRNLNVSTMYMNIKKRLVLSPGRTWYTVFTKPEMLQRMVFAVGVV